MGLKLHSIELMNFKSYQGKVIVGPLKSFMSVIGPNGTGKSNFLDAVMFALGANLTELRATRPGDLINGAATGKPTSKTTYVMVAFKREEGALYKFKRTASKSSHQYFINEEPVSCREYIHVLKNLGLSSKSNNFFVYQGRIEEIVMMKAYERTRMFEEISGSIEFKAEYDQLKTEMSNVSSEAQSNFVKHRTVRNEHKDAKLMRKEAEDFEDAHKDLAEKITLLRIFKLFHNDISCRKYQEKKSEKQIQLEEEKSIKEGCLQELQKAKKNHRVAESVLVSLTDKVQTKENEIKKKLPQLLKSKEQVSHIRKKISTAQLSWVQAIETNDKCQDNLKILQDSLAVVEEEQRIFESDALEESISQGRDIELEESQANEYNELKRQALNLSVSFQQQLDSLTREMRADQDQLDSGKRKYADLEMKLKQKEQEKEETIKRMDNISARILSHEEELKTLKENASNIATHKTEMDMMQEELSQIISELQEMQSYRNEECNQNRKRKAITSLRDSFPGVYDRLINLCEPVHQKFNIALTKVMGKWIDAIVVDKETTARLCIKYLKSNCMQPEVFLPLDYIQVGPLRDSLRQIKEALLVYDVVKYNPPEVKKSVLFATKNVLICDTPDDAMRVAYETYTDRILDVVALDGTYFQKNGLISGGKDHLVQKAKQWNEKLLAKMTEKKEKLTEGLKSKAKQIFSETESNVSCKIKGYDTRIELMGRDLEKSRSKIAMIDSDIQDIKNRLQNLEPKVRDIEGQIHFRNVEINKLDRKLRSIEDEVFSEFCQRIGVSNIRAFEEGGLRSQKERLLVRMEFEERKTRIQNEIEYQKNVDTAGNIQRWFDEVENRLAALKTAEETMDEYNSEVEADRLELENYKQQVVSQQNNVADLSQKKKELEKEIKTKSEAVHAVQQEILSIESEIERLVLARRLILIDCKADGTVLPLLQGNLESLDSSESENSTIEDIVIDYDDLPDELKNVDEDTVREKEKSLTNTVLALSKRVKSMKVPNMKAVDVVSETTRRLHNTAVECRDARDKARQISENFEIIKKKRFDKYMNLLDFVSEKIDTIYKELTQSNSAMALVSADNPEEPYLKGLHYSCIVPGKACKPMESLSGGEKTIASLALLLALHQYGNASLLILDEVDAALDNVNIGKVLNFLYNHKEDFQTIAVSLRPEYFGEADGLIGITRDFQDGEPPTSKVYLLDLEVYPRK